MGTKTRLQTTAGERTTDWQSTIIVGDGSTVTTMVSGRGYFVNTTSAAALVKLPATPKIGDFVEIKDYARTFGTNACTVQTNSSKVDGAVISSTALEDDGKSVKFIFTDDGTRGWTAINDDSAVSYGATFTAASGGTESTSGNFKIHTFTGDGTFTVTKVGNAAGGSNAVSYMVVAGAGAGGFDRGGGGGAGGFREGRNPSCSYTVSPLNNAGGLVVTAQAYPITVGAGGAGASSPGQPNIAGAGSNSIFSSITSTGGGQGQNANASTPTADGGSGGSGGGGSGSGSAGSNEGQGNTPPVSPPQGNPGGVGYDGPSPSSGGGGGGAGAVGSQANNPAYPSDAGGGGFGVETHIPGSPLKLAGGGGGGHPQSHGGNAGAGGAWNATPNPGLTAPSPQADRFGAGNGTKSGPAGGTAGTANTGSGGGGSEGAPGAGGAGGKGIVVIRYRYQ